MIKSSTGTEYVNAQLLDIKDLIDYYADRIRNYGEIKVVEVTLDETRWVDTGYGRCWHIITSGSDQWFIGPYDVYYVTLYNGQVYAKCKTLDGDISNHYAHRHPGGQTNVSAVWAPWMNKETFTNGPSAGMFGCLGSDIIPESKVNPANKKALMQIVRKWHG